MNLRSLKKRVPWWTRMFGKVVFSKMPISYSLWKRWGLFEHGSMEEPSYAFDVFKRHFERVPPLSKNFVCLELGPGDSLCSLIIARAFGAGCCYLIDTGDYVAKNLAPYQKMVSFLKSRRLLVPEIGGSYTLNDLLSAFGGIYRTQGVDSLKEIRDKTVDFIWSQAVMEHIRKKDFKGVVCELRRIIRPGGYCSFRIDLKDHLGGALNNLRFSEGFWEADFIAQSGFYTNRLRYSEILVAFAEAGFTANVVNVERWPQLPTPRHRLAKKFRGLPDQELCVSGLDVILSPK